MHSNIILAVMPHSFWIHGVWQPNTSHLSTYFHKYRVVKNNPSRSVINEFNPCMISVPSIKSRLCRRDAEVMPIPYPAVLWSISIGYTDQGRIRLSRLSTGYVRFRITRNPRPFYHSLWRYGYSTCQYPGYSVSLLNAVVYLMKRIGIWHLLIYHSCLVNPLTGMLMNWWCLSTHSIYLHSISVRVRYLLLFTTYRTSLSAFVLQHSIQWLSTSQVQLTMTADVHRHSACQSRISTYIRGTDTLCLHLDWILTEDPNRIDII